jgi:hypothetical protein
LDVELDADPLPDERAAGLEAGGSGRGMRGGTSVSSTVMAGMAINSGSE